MGLEWPWVGLGVLWTFVSAYLASGGLNTNTQPHPKQRSLDDAAAS